MTLMSFVSPLAPLAIESGGEMSYVATDETRFTVLRPFDAGRAKQTIAILQNHINARKHHDRPRLAAREQLDVLAQAQSLDQFCDGLERLFETFACTPLRSKRWQVNEHGAIVDAFDAEIAPPGFLDTLRQILDAMNGRSLSIG